MQKCILYNNIVVPNYVDIRIFKSVNGRSSFQVY